MCDRNSHELKCLPEYFNATWNGKKFFEVRRYDRDFQVGDEIVLREWEHDPITGVIENGYTGRRIVGVITYVTTFHQEPGFVVMGFRETSRLTPR